MSFFKIIRAVVARREYRRLVLGAAFVALVLLSGQSDASTTSARRGTVVTIHAGEATTSQRDYSYDSSTRQDESRVRSVIGGVLGGVVGSTLARHSGSYGRFTASAGGASIGTAIGYAMDRRADARQDQVRDSRSSGAQVIVQLDDSKQTVAVFSRRLSGIYPGAKVWLVGDEELIPAN